MLSEGEDSYVYAIVVRAEPFENGALSKVTLRMSPDASASPVCVLSSNVFVLASKLGSSTSSPASISSSSSFPLSTLAPSAASISTHSPQTQSGPLLQTLAKIGMTEEGALAQEGSEDLMLRQALASMLSRVGLPLDLSRQSLVDETLALQGQVAAEKGKMGALLDKVQRLSEELDRLQNAFICQICLFREVDKTLVMCGHSVCGDCEHKIRQKKECPFCRSRYEYTIPFFKPF